MIGGGFAGLQVAKSLRRAPVYVVVVDRQNHHLFQPLLYQVATAGLAAPDIAAPIRRILRHQDNASVLYAEVTAIATARRVVPLGARALARKILPDDFRNFDPKQTEGLLVEGGPRVLAADSEDLSASAQRQLERLGVTVRTGAQVTGIDAEGVTVAGGERIPARTVLWAAGVQVSPLLGGLGAPTDRAGRGAVEPDLSVPGHPDVYVIGDAAQVPWKDGLVPGVAPAALQMGKHAAKQIQRRLRGEATTAFRYLDKGSMATIGRASAVAEIGGRHLRGLLAWLAWLFVHLLFLVGFRSRLVVLINWIWAYVGYRPVARVLAALADEDGPRAARTSEPT